MGGECRASAGQGKRSRPNGFGQSGLCEWLPLGTPSGAHWCDLPDRYGTWKTVHRRFSRWCHAGVWERVFEALTADRDNQYLMLAASMIWMI
ncbi:transposase [Marivibrio halodurans]|uniref:transposase n=1 Tax=Marivibrio halodurans TaxID=2039722 RepID=UPI003611E9A1